jgi:hypothetical protein
VRDVMWRLHIKKGKPKKTCLPLIEFPWRFSLRIPHDFLRYDGY